MLTQRSAPTAPEPETSENQALQVDQQLKDLDQSIASAQQNGDLSIDNLLELLRSKERLLESEVARRKEEKQQVEEHQERLIEEKQRIDEDLKREKERERRLMEELQQEEEKNQRLKEELQRVEEKVQEMLSRAQGM